MDQQYCDCKQDSLFDHLSQCNMIQNSQFTQQQRKNKKNGLTNYFLIIKQNQSFIIKKLITTLIKLKQFLNLRYFPIFVRKQITPSNSILSTPVQLLTFKDCPMPSNRPIANFLKQYIRFPLTKELTNALPIPQKVTIPNIHKFCQKISRMRQEPDNIELITDYDHTLTKYKHENMRCDSLFGMWPSNQDLPTKFRQQLTNNYLLYGPYETDGTISFLQRYELINQFYTVQTRLFQTHKVSVQMACKTLAKSRIVFRPYSRRLFEILAQGKVPVYIISGGISDFIYTTVDQLCGKVQPNISIHSNELEMYQLDEINGGHKRVDYNTMEFWNAVEHRGNVNRDGLIVNQVGQQYLIKFRSPLIHSYNKFEIMRNHTSKRRHCILMGDLVSDIYMAQGVNYDTIFSVFYAKEGDTDQRAIAQQKFDLIVEGDGSHKIVVQLMKVILGKKNINWQYLTNVHRNLHQYLV